MSSIATAAINSGGSKKLIGKFGRLWGRCFETFQPESRRILSINGPHAQSYLQGLVTSDLTKNPQAPIDYTYLSAPSTKKEDSAENDSNQQNDKVPTPFDDEEDLDSIPEPEVHFNPHLRSVCFLNHKGRILTDALLWEIPPGPDQSETSYLIDVPSDTATDLLQHLKTFKLRRTKVKIQDVTENTSSHVIYGTLHSESGPDGYQVGLDPRHPSLGLRVLSQRHDPSHLSSLLSSASDFPRLDGTYHVLRKLSGIAEGTEIVNKTALETNQEWLQAVHFDKGCYLGQELTARSHFTGVIRKRIMPLILVDTRSSIPLPWNIAQQTARIIEQQQNDAREQSQILPQLSASSVAGFSWSQNNDSSERTTNLPQSAEFLEQLYQEAQPGTNLVNVEDESNAGQIISTPAPGTTVVLAQMRLDQLGMISGKTTWKRTNRIRLSSDGPEYRYLPYMPLWWPPVSFLDPKTGKMAS